MTTSYAANGARALSRTARRLFPCAALALLATCGPKAADFFEPTKADIMLFPGSITGSVTINGRAAAGVTVSSGTRSVTTGSDGSYIITALPAGSHAVGVSGLPANVTCSPAAGVATVSPGVAARLDFACRQPTSGSVAGVVTINGTGTAGITVMIGNRLSITGGGGVYRIDAIDPGAFTVSVSGLPVGTSCSPSVREVTVAAGEVATASFACTRPTTGSLTGTVVVNGTPTAGITVSVGNRLATTNAGGIYRIDSLPPGTAQASLLELPPNTTCTPSSQTVTITAGEVSMASFACTRSSTGALTGTVIVNGIPTAGITVTAGGRFATTGSGGMYRIDSLPPGTSQASLLELPPSTTCTASSQTVTILAGQVTVANFTCVRPTTGSVSGLITINDLPAAGLTVFSGLVSGTTQENGTYRLDGLLPGSGAVFVVLPENVTCVPSSGRTVLIVVGLTATANFVCARSSSTFLLGVVPSYRHLGSTSEVCVLVTTTPARPNAAFSGMLTGPGVVNGAVSGTLSASGTSQVRFAIVAFGSYTGFMIVLAQRVDFTMNVTSAAGSCAP